MTIVQGHLDADTSVVVTAGTGLSLLVALARASGGPRAGLAADLADALDSVGDRAGETWLNLLGVPLDGGPPYSAERLLAAVAESDPAELRRHLLGRHAWSWCTLAGAGTIEEAAAGEAAASERLLAHPRYYAGRARESLSVLLPLDPVETRRRLARAIEAGLDHLLPPAGEAALAAAAAFASAAVGDLPLVEAIERVTGGYRYVPEPEAEQVVLVPHLEPSPWLVLAQHRAARLIVYAAPRTTSSEERLAAVGQALADPKRVEILALLGRGARPVAQLVRETGLTRSTVHHHLAKLRDARLVDLQGNARAYRYAARAGAVEEVRALLGELLGEAS